MKENGYDTTRNVIEVSNSIGVRLSENEISVVHRLPSRKSLKPVRVRSCLSIAKIKFSENKNKLASLSGLNDAKFYEDITRPRVNFIKKMRSDETVESVWRRDSTKFFVWKKDKKLYNIGVVFQSEAFMDSSLNNVTNCFTGVFSGAQQQQKT